MWQHIGRYRAGEREIFCLPCTGSFSKCPYLLNLAKQNPNIEKVFLHKWQVLNSLSHHCYLPVYTLAGNWNQDWSQISNPGALVWGVGILLVPRPLHQIHAPCLTFKYDVIHQTLKQKSIHSKSRINKRQRQRERESERYLATASSPSNGHNGKDWVRLKPGVRSSRSAMWL